MIYLINTKTKEHIDAMTLGDAEYGRLAGSSGWIVQMADPDGWIEWPGGDCPLPDGHLCDVKHLDGDEGHGKEAGRTGRNIGWGPAAAEDWSHDGVGGDIIAYRPIIDADTKPEPPAWDGDVPPVGAYVEYPTGRGVVKLPPDRDGVTVVEDDGSKCAGEAGTYKRVAACACEPIRSEEDRAVEEMERAYRTDPSSPSVTHGMRHLYRAIRDGKVPGVKLTGGEG